MTKSETNSDSWVSRNRKNTLRVAGWTAAWVMTTAITAFGPKLVWDFATLPTILALLVNLGVGFGMIWAYKQHVAGMDEMQQKIFLEAGAISLGAGLVFGCAYEQLEDIRLIPFEPEISHLIILMSAAFMIGMLNGHRKYR
jgi:hypothetical protein